MRNGNADAAFEQFVERFRQEKHYRRVFDARLMQKRQQLGLPLVSTSARRFTARDGSAHIRTATCARRAKSGNLFLRMETLPQAWPYFRAIGDTQPISGRWTRSTSPKPETPESQEALGSTIHIAFQEGPAPPEGLRVDPEALRPVPRHYDVWRLPPGGGPETIRSACSSGRSTDSSSKTSATRSRTSRGHGRTAIRLLR